MDPMPLRSIKQPAESTQTQFEVGMNKERPGREDKTNDASCLWREIEQDSHRDRDRWDAPHVLKPMIPIVRGHVDSRIHVVKLVNCPKRWAFLFRAGPPVIEE